MSGKILEFIFGLSSLIGLIITGIIFLFAVIEGTYSTQSDIIIFSFAAIIVALAVVCIILLRRAHALSQDNALMKPALDSLSGKIKTLKTKSIEQNDDFSEIADICHSVHDQLRDRIFELYTAHIALVSGESISKTELVDYDRTNEMFYLFMLNNIKTIFDIITEDKCAVCIKILEEGDSNNDIMLRTFMRDSGSYRERKSSDKSIFEYPYYENTAFKTILAPETPDSYYASDDLSAEKTYINMNSNWNDAYNATLVCPIRMELVTETESEFNEYSVLGFVCIDNMKGGLNNRAAIQLLAALSDSLYNHFLLFSELQNSALESENKDKNIAKKDNKK